MSTSVAVLMGGWSSEREVSLVSGGAIVDALANTEFDVRAIDVQRDVAGL
ncbi:MAG: D-alanine--D-alanine ligase, partial [Alphaproteobacteria bacterium]